jgi:hypothetical protein
MSMSKLPKEEQIRFIKEMFKAMGVKANIIEVDRDVNNNKPKVKPVKKDRIKK